MDLKASAASALPLSQFSIRFDRCEALLVFGSQPLIDHGAKFFLISLGGCAS